jgi:predicted  nucleic acid-binding Zn-ribbon protein
MDDFLIKALEVLGTAGFALLAMYIKDVVSKNLVKEKVKILEENHKELEKTVDQLDTEMRRIAEKQIGGLRDLYNLNKSLDEFKTDYKKELTNVNKTMGEVSTSLNHLSIAVEGLKGYLEAQRDQR